MVAQSDHPPPCTSIALPLPSDFHFHRPSTFTPLFLCACADCLQSSDRNSECSTTPADKRRNYSNCFPSAPVNALPLQRTRDEIIRIVFRHMSVGVLSMLCSNAFCPGYDQIKMVVVLLLALCAPVNALLLQRTRYEIIRIIYEQGFQCGLILCFLISVYGICISLSTLKRCLTRQHLKGEGVTVIYNILE